MAARQATVRKMAPAPIAPTNTALQKLAQNFSIELAPFADGDKALAFQQEAVGITVSDKATHQAALEALRRGKALKRGIDDHWRKVLRWLEDRKTDIRNIMITDMEFVEPGITRLNRLCLEYEAAERVREQEEIDRKRREEEERARAAREKELAELEQQALTAESTSADLSERERRFVDLVFGGALPTAAASLCGYKDPVAHGNRLMGTTKILVALEGKQTAKAILAQRDAVAQKPVEVKKVEVDSNRAKVSGTRTVVTHTGTILDHAACVAHLLEGGPDAPPSDLFIVNGVKLNEYARSMHENIERWRGVRYNRSETKAG